MANASDIVLPRFHTPEEMICPAYVRTPLVENQIASQPKAHRISEDDVIDQLMLGPAAIKHLVSRKKSQIWLFISYPNGRDPSRVQHM